MDLIHSSPDLADRQGRRAAASRVLPVVRLGWGTFLGVAPARALRLLGGEDTPPARLILRVLGARHVAEAALETIRPGRYLGALAAGDGLHALTAVGLAVSDRRWRRPALTDAVIATGFAVWTWRR